MKRCNGFFVILAVFVLLSGCATIGKVTGFDPQARESFDVQEPWHNLVIRGDISEVNEMAVSYIPIPQPLPEKLFKEIFYSRPAPKEVAREGENKTDLQRWSLRALMYREENFVGMFDVFVDFPRRVFVPFFPLNGKYSEYRYKGSDLNFLILSSNGMWVMTVYGKIVELSEGVSLLELPSGFFSEHPSRMPEIGIVRRNDPEGQKSFARWESLEDGFPRRYEFRGKKYSGKPNALYAHDTFTSNKHVLDRLVSCGSLTGSLAWANPIGLGISLGPQMVNNVRVGMRENCDVSD